MARLSRRLDEHEGRAPEHLFHRQVAAEEVSTGHLKDELHGDLGEARRTSSRLASSWPKMNLDLPSTSRLPRDRQVLVFGEVAKRPVVELPFELSREAVD